jgi:hypothetical protein
MNLSFLHVDSISLAVLSFSLSPNVLISMNIYWANEGSVLPFLLNILCATQLDKSCFIMCGSLQSPSVLIWCLLSYFHLYSKIPKIMNFYFFTIVWPMANLRLNRSLMFNQLLVNE